MITAVELEERRCSKCQRPFKVLAGSAQTECSRLCAGLSDWGPIQKTKRNTKGGVVDKSVDKTSKDRLSIKGRRPVDQYEPKWKPPSVEVLSANSQTVVPDKTDTKPQIENITTPPLRLTEPSPQDGGLEARWEHNIKAARTFVSKMARHRLEVAALAAEVCDIKHGGGAHWNDFEGVYTSKKFAEEVGLNPKTLHNWIRVKRNVYDKLTAINVEIDPLKDWPALQRTADFAKATDTPEAVKKRFEKWQEPKEKAKFNHAKHLLVATRRFKSFAYYLEHKAEPKKFHRDDVEMFEKEITRILKWFKKNREQVRG